MVVFLTILAMLSVVSLGMHLYNSSIGFVSGILTLFLIACCFSFSVIAFDTHYKEGYKRGQIDAATGKQKYHLTTQPAKWKLKEN